MTVRRGILCERPILAVDLYRLVMMMMVSSSGFFYINKYVCTTLLMRNMNLMNRLN